MTGAVVLVHGNGGSAQSFCRVAAAMPLVSVRAIDLPGFGANRNVALPRKDELRAFTDAVLAACPMQGEVVLVGAGTGAVLCGHAALRLGDRAVAVVMLGPVGLPAGHAKFAALARTGFGAFCMRIAGGSAIARGRFLRDQLARPSADREAREILVRGLLLARGFAAMSRAVDASALLPLAQLRCPVTVLWGGKDGVLPASRAPEFMAHLPKTARLEVHAELAHAIALEAPDVVALAIHAAAT